MYSAFAPYEYFEDEEEEVANVVNNQAVEQPAAVNNAANVNNVGVAAANAVLAEEGNPEIMLEMLNVEDLLNRIDEEVEEDDRS